MHSLKHMAWEALTQSHVNPDAQTLKPVSTLLGHRWLLRQELLLCIPSLKSLTTLDFSSFPLA